MSLILDALSRAERDRRREQGPAPDLLADHEPIARPSGLSLSRLSVLVVLSLVLGGVALWLVMRDGSRGSGEAGVPAAPGRSLSRAPPPAQSAEEPPATPPRGSVADGRPQAGQPGPAPVAAADRPSTVAVPAGEAISRAQIARLYEQRNEGDGITDAGAAGNAGSAADLAPDDSPAERPRAFVDAEPPPDAGERAATREESPVELEQVLRRARAEMAASSLSAHPAPLLQTLSKQYRDRVPTLMYLRHDYNPARNSTVLINGATLRVGERSRGVEVREILADSVILRFEDQDFRLRALNSWVNL